METRIDLSEIMNFSPSIDLWGRAEGSAPDPERKTSLSENNNKLPNCHFGCIDERKVTRLPLVKIKRSALNCIEVYFRS